MSTLERKTQYDGTGFVSKSINDFGLTGLQSNNRISQDVRQSKSSNQELRLAPINAKNAITIPYSQLQQMKEHSALGEHSEASRKAQQRQQLYEISQAKAKNWPNTIYTMRKRKDEARFEKFKKEEEQRRKVDLEQAKFKAEQRRRVIEQANKQLYENNDKVRGFQSKLLLVDALAEREVQIELKNQINEIDKIRDKMYADQALETLKRLQEQEDAKQKVEQKKKEVTQRVLKEQHDDMKIRYIKKLQDEKIEGEIIKQTAIDLIEKENQAEAARRRKAIELQQEIRQNNEHLSQLKEEKVLAEQQEERKIEEYAQMKDTMIQMRQDREHQMFIEKQNQKQKLIDAQTKILEEIQSKEDQRINQQIKQAEIKAENVEKAKRQYRENLKKRIDESLNQTLAQKSALSEFNRQEDKNFQEFWHNKNHELRNQELKDQEDRRNQVKHLAEYHLKQADEKQQQREEDFIQELDEAERIQRQLENDDNNFQSWAERAVSEWADNGKNIKPLLTELTQTLKTTK